MAPADSKRETPGINFPEHGTPASSGPTSNGSTHAAWSPLAAPRASGVNDMPIAAFSREEEMTAYREMLMIRRFEEKAGQLYGMGFIGGFCHLYIGQEAVVVGLQMAGKG